jgi:oxalate decarboxylase
MDSSGDLARARRLQAGVNMRLNAGGVRELHWHKASEWAYMLYGTARITAVDAQGRNFVDDVGVGDLWFFPAGIPHSIQGLNRMAANFFWSLMTATSTKTTPS